MDGNATGKPKKQRRAIPPGLNKKEEKILKKVTRRAYRLDNCISFCGVRIGWGTVIGVVPAYVTPTSSLERICSHNSRLGDVFDVLMALMVFRACTQAELPAALRSRMLFNIVLDFAIGLVPILGDIGDAFFRCNTRNAALLYNHLKARGQARIEADEKTIGRSLHRQEHSPSQHRGRVGQQPLPAGQIQSAQRSKDDNLNARAPQSQRFVNPDDIIAKPKNAKLSKERSPVGSWVNRLKASDSKGPANGEEDIENGDRTLESLVPK